MPKREAARAALRELQQLANEDSADGGDSDADVPCPEVLCPRPVDSTDSETNSSSDDENESPSTVTGTGGWRGIPVGTYNRISGRVLRRNVFRESVGVKPSLRRIVSTPYDAWKAIIDERLLRHVNQCTTAFAETSKPTFNLSLDELEKFIGLQYARGIYGNHHSVSFLWSASFGYKLFTALIQ